jgi:hypothetical protein
MPWVPQFPCARLHVLAGFHLSHCCWTPAADLSTPSYSTALTELRVRVRVTSSLAVYRPSVHLGAKPLETLDQHFFPTEPLRSLPLFNVLSGESMGLASAAILGSEFCRTDDHILLSQIRDFPNLEVQVFVFISPRNRVVRLYLQALGSLS